MGLRTLASGTLKPGVQAIYTAPIGRWAAIDNIQLVNKTGSDLAVSVALRSASSEVQLTPAGFTLRAGHKLELDQNQGLNPGGYIKVTVPTAGFTFVVTGEERTAQ